MKGQHTTGARSCSGAQTDDRKYIDGFTWLKSCHLFSIFFPTRSEEDGHDDELKDAAEDKQYTDKHPDIKEGNVRNSGKYCAEPVKK